MCPDATDPADPKQKKELDDTIDATERDAVRVAAVVISLCRGLGSQFNVNLISIVLGLFDAATALGQVLLQDAARHSNDVDLPTIIKLRHNLLSEKLIDVAATFDTTARSITVHASATRN